MLSENKKRIIMTAVIVASTVILIVSGVLSAVTNAFAVNAFLHIYIKVLSVYLLIIVVRKIFKKEIPKNIDKAMFWVGGICVIDLVIVDAIRYILAGGIVSVFFCPACIPICFMILMIYQMKENRMGEAAEKRLIYMIGIPWALLSLMFEIESFM